MTEIFTNLPVEFKQRVKFMWEMAIRQSNLPKTMKVIKNFMENCSEEEKEFIDFYIQMQGVQINEDIID